MQNSRHLQILKELNLVRRFWTNDPDLATIWLNDGWRLKKSINKSLHDLEHAAFKHRAEMQERSRITQTQINNFVKGGI